MGDWGLAKRQRDMEKREIVFIVHILIKNIKIFNGDNVELLRFLNNKNKTLMFEEI